MKIKRWIFFNQQNYLGSELNQFNSFVLKFCYSKSISTRHQFQSIKTIHCHNLINTQSYTSTVMIKKYNCCIQCLLIILNCITKSFPSESALIHKRFLKKKNIRKHQYRVFQQIFNKNIQKQG